MDILTHGLLGAALAQSAARPNEARMAAWIGFAAGLAADADVLIGSAGDPLLAIEYHRHFTHAFLFIPFGALIVAALLWPFVRTRMAFGRLYVFALLGYSLHGFLDACTSFGTYLLWPFVQERITFNVIAVVDPVFTLVLLTGVAVAWKKRQRMAAHIGLAVAAAYLLFGWVQHERAAALVHALADGRGHRIERVVVKPTLGNLLLWRTIYQADGRYYVDAVRAGIFAGPRVYEGGSLRMFVLERDLPRLPPSSVLYRDIVRFTVLSDDFVAIHPDRPEVLADARYSNEPTSIRPLWGIEMDLSQPQRHVPYAFYRDLSRDTRQRFFAMLFNRDI